jgi:hypothetical protein
MSNLQIRRSCLLLAPMWLVCRVGGALPGVLIQSHQSEKAWLWCHSGNTSAGTGSVHRQLLPGLLLWQPSQSLEDAGGRCPCFEWKLSQLTVAFGKWRHGQQLNMFDLSSSGWRIPNTLLAQATMPHGLKSPQAFVQLGSGTHQAEQASLQITLLHRLSWIQGLTLNTGYHGL